MKVENFLHFQKQSGVTLIEVLVALSLFAVVVSVAVPSLLFSSFPKRTENHKL